MMLSLRFLSSNSGKAVVLQINGETYLFNIYEGFQRYAIEAQFSLTTINTIFLTSKTCIPGLMGTYLTLTESQKDHINIVSNFDTHFFDIYKFCNKPLLKLDFLYQYKDKYISVEMFDMKGITNFIVTLPKVLGSIRADEIPDAIPKKMYREFMSTGEVTVDNNTYYLSSYKDDDVELNKVALIFSDIDNETAQDLENYISKIPCVICFTNSTFVYLSKVRNFETVFGGNMTGLFYVRNNDFIEYVDFYEQQQRLNTRFPHILLPHSNITDDSPISNSDIFPGDKLNFAKKTGAQLMRSTQQKPQEVSYKPLYPSIEFLGTGCAIPSKYRNVSAILYQNENSAILMDSGEDTVTQMYRLHGNLNTLKKLKIIYISHNHADHMLGIAAVVKSMSTPVLIIAPKDVKEYITYFGIVSNEISPDGEITLRNGVSIITTDFIKIKESSFYKMADGDNLDISDYVQKIYFEEFEIVICGCMHSKSSASVAITDRSLGKKFSYSGDTVPSKLFEIIAAESDVMIHEATFENALIYEARKRMHTTDVGALSVFEHSKSKKLLLTHVSNRSNISDDDPKYVRDFYRFDFK